MNQPSLVQAWWLAARPKTLWAGLAPVLVGTAVAHAHGGIALLPASAAAVGSILIQIATNLANDYFDHKKGADNADRIGPARAVQQGWIAPQAMLTATIAVLGLALMVGTYLIAVGGAPIAAIGLASLVCAVAYTGGPLPLAYVGLGDVFVFGFFGLAAVVGTVWVQVLAAPPAAWLGGVCMGLLATAILVVNNLRDRVTDAAANKRTLAVRFGPRVARWEHSLAIAAPFAVVAGGAATGWIPTASAALTVLALPLAVREIRCVRMLDGPALNPHLGGAARLELVFGLLFSVGFFL
jgi:1,4-dihydroxy-2-naphthoate octaprenyltransferase